MTAKIDVATLLGHEQPILHLAESIIYEVDSSGTISVKEIIDDLADDVNGVITVYNSDDSLTDNRVIDGNGFSLTLNALDKFQVTVQKTDEGLGLLPIDNNANGSIGSWLSLSEDFTRYSC